MKKFILLAALVALFVSGQVLACDSTICCSVTIEYQDASSSKIAHVDHKVILSLEQAKDQARTQACETLCKGAEACIKDCNTKSIFKDIQCGYNGTAGGSYTVEIAHQGASALATGLAIEETKGFACEILCRGNKACVKNCSTKGEIRAIQCAVVPPNGVCAAEVAINYLDISAFACAFVYPLAAFSAGAKPRAEAIKQAKAHACEILCLGAEACMKDCKVEGVIDSVSINEDSLCGDE